MDKTKNKKLIADLRRLTDEAIKKRKRELDDEAAKKREEENALKKNVADLIAAHVSEEKLKAVTAKRVGYYPVLKVAYDYQPERNKIYTAEEIGPIGAVLMQELRLLNLPPELKKLAKEDMNEDGDTTKPLLFDPTIVPDPGLYVCIFW